MFIGILEYSVVNSIFINNHVLKLKNQKFGFIFLSQNLNFAENSISAKLLLKIQQVRNSIESICFPKIPSLPFEIFNIIHRFKLYQNK